MLVRNMDWDPSYLKELFSEDFYEFSEMWYSDVNDRDLVVEVEGVEHYSPVTEDITLEDDELCRAVEKIEHE